MAVLINDTIAAQSGIDMEQQTEALNAFVSVCKGQRLSVLMLYKKQDDGKISGVRFCGVGPGVIYNLSCEVGHIKMIEDQIQCIPIRQCRIGGNRYRQYLPIVTALGGDALDGIVDELREISDRVETINGNICR